jgi:hypothetical protein
MPRSSHRTLLHRYNEQYEESLRKLGYGLDFGLLKEDQRWTEIRLGRPSAGSYMNGNHTFGCIDKIITLGAQCTREWRRQIEAAPFIRVSR